MKRFAIVLAGLFVVIVVGGAMEKHRAAPLMMGLGMTAAFASGGWLMNVVGPMLGIDPEWVHRAAALSLILFGLFLWGSNQLHHATEKGRVATIARVNRLDALFQVGLTLLLIILLAVDWYIVDTLH